MLRLWPNFTEFNGKGNARTVARIVTRLFDVRFVETIPLSTGGRAVVGEWEQLTGGLRMKDLTGLYRVELSLRCQVSLSSKWLHIYTARKRTGAGIYISAEMWPLVRAWGGEFQRRFRVSFLCPTDTILRWKREEMKSSRSFNIHRFPQQMNAPTSRRIKIHNYEYLEPSKRSLFSFLCCR